MSRVALELGETSIDRAKITPTPDGGYRMQWSMRLLNGRLIKKTTKGKCTKGELRRRAHAQAEEILATGGCSYSFVNWEMLSVRPNRGMLTPSH